MNPETMAILIPTRNRPAILRRTLEELGARGFGGHPLCVYDDASEDPKAVAEVVARWPSSRLIRSDVRTGQARGRNRLLREGRSEFALFLKFTESRETTPRTIRQAVKWCRFSRSCS